MDGTILSQGTFTQPATAINQTLIVPSAVDWLEVYNFTQAAGTAGNGYFFYWQRGMGTKGIVNLSGAAHAVTVNQTVANAFVLFDPTQYSLNQNALGPVNNGSTGVTGFTAANPAVVTVGATAGMSAGNVVVFSSLNNQPQYNGIPFSVGYGTLTGTTFSVDYLNATGSTPSTSGNFRVSQFDPLFYPRRRFITQITTGFPTVITLSVDHSFTVGQEVRLSFPGGTAIWGSFANLDQIAAIITAVDTATGVGHNTITVNVDSTGFLGPTGGSFVNTFAVFLATNVPFTPALVVPIGEDTATSLASNAAQVPLGAGGVPIYNANTQLLADSTANTAYLGILLAAGAALPAGVAADVVFWKAGKSTLGGL